MAERPGRAARAILALERRADSRGFLPAVALFPMADYLLPVLPNQMLLAGLSMLRPALWWRLALVFAVAGGLGAGLVAGAIQHWGEPLVAALFGLAPDGARDVLAAVERYGLPALAAFSLLPWPPRTAVVVCAVAGVPPGAMALAVAGGRCVPAVALAFAGSRAPGLLRRSRRVDAVMRDVEAARAA